MKTIVLLLAALAAGYLGGMPGIGSSARERKNTVAGSYG